MRVSAHLKTPLLDSKSVTNGATAVLYRVNWWNKIKVNNNMVCKDANLTTFFS